MSRTFRKRMESFEQHYGDLLTDDWFVSMMERQLGDTWLDRLKAQYYGKTEKWHYYNLPKWFRKDVNRQRRRKDNQKLHRLLTEDFDGVMFDPWNCKTNNSWGYW